jgi:hypothetical protein
MAVAGLLAGCLGADDEPQPATGAPLAIAEAVERLERATAERDFELICRDLLTPAARERAGGGDCVRLTRSAAAGVVRPVAEIEGIDVDGARARVTLRTRAAGQAQASEVLLLRRQGGEWRVDSLGG